MRNFASDNNAPVCPEAWDAMAVANTEHSGAYGSDSWTAEACDLMRGIFETNCEVFFVFNGTAANSLALASMAQSYHSVIGHEISHIETDECGAPEFYSGGSKLLLVPGENGRIQPDEVERVVHRRSDIHFPKPKVLSLTQSTEVGTVYSPDMLRELGAITHGLGLKIHMDGARFANAVASLGCPPKEITWKAGVDVLCFGGTKNGMAIGEAVIFFNREMAEEFDYRCKQAGQLCSKMRYLSSPWVGMLKDGAWLRHAEQANRSARYLSERLAGLAGVDILHPTEANAVFVRIEERVISGLYQRGWQFYDFIAAGGCRLMCSWDTTREDIDRFVSDIAEIETSGEDHRKTHPAVRH